MDDYVIYMLNSFVVQIFSVDRKFYIFFVLFIDLYLFFYYFYYGLDKFFEKCCLNRKER